MITKKIKSFTGTLVIYDEKKKVTEEKEQPIHIVRGSTTAFKREYEKENPGKRIVDIIDVKQTVKTYYMSDETFMMYGTVKEEEKPETKNEKGEKKK